MIGFTEKLKESKDSTPGVNLASPPWVHVDGIDNFRDVGGYPLADGSQRSVRRHFCYRCADPARISRDGKTKMESLGITTVFDLRSMPEVSKNAVGNYNSSNPSTTHTPSPFDDVESITRHHVPVFKEQELGMEAMARGYGNYLRGGPEGFCAAYRDILDNGPNTITTIMTHVRDKPGEPFVLHCSAGKDRTGVIVALMLLLIGVSEETISKEYELTEIGLARMKPFVIDHLIKDPGLKGDREGIERMVSARKENMMASLRMIRDEYGGAEGYLKNYCKLTDDDIVTIKKNLIDNEPAVLEA